MRFKIEEENIQKQINKKKEEIEVLRARLANVKEKIAKGKRCR